jgi:transposase-like protein
MMSFLNGTNIHDQIIVLCLRWYLGYPLSYRNLEEMTSERQLQLDYSMTAGWVFRYAPVLNQRLRSECAAPLILAGG